MILGPQHDCSIQIHVIMRSVIKGLHCMWLDQIQSHDPIMQFIKVRFPIRLTTNCPTWTGILYCAKDDLVNVYRSTIYVQ